MAKKKSELEMDAAHYYARLEQMRLAHSDGAHQSALAHAIAAWKYADGMLQFERRFEGESERESLECVEYALEYAPLLLDSDALNRLTVLLKSQKRIDRSTEENLSQKLELAYYALNDAHRLWDLLERGISVQQNFVATNLGGSERDWSALIEKWEQMGLLCRAPHLDTFMLWLATRLESAVRAKCSSCGVVARAAKGRFWEAITCPKCRVSNVFVILVPENAPAGDS